MSDYLLAFQRELVEAVKTALDEIADGGNSQGIALIGPSGAGKTYGLDEVARLHPPYMDGNQPKVPCCRSSITTKADAGATAGGVLRALGKSVVQSTRQSIRQLEPDMQSAMIARGVRILMLEEFHNALLAGTPELRGQISRLVKNVWNQHRDDTPLSWAKVEPNRGDLRLVIVLAATEELLPVLERDEELASRFPCVIHAPRLAFSPKKSFRQFRLVLRSLATRFGISELLPVNDDSVASRCLFACGAHLRVLESLLQRVATLSKKAPEGKSCLELLANAYDQVGGTTAKAKAKNPFRWSEDELTDRVAKALPDPRASAPEGDEDD